MKNGLKRFIGRVPDVSAVLARFPVPAALMAVFTLGIMFEDELNDFDRFGYIMAGLVLAGYLCVSFAIARESQKKTPALLIQGGISVLILSLAWTAQSLLLEPAMAIAASILILGNAVIYRQARNDLKVWDFTHKIWTGVGFATLGSIIFTLGVFAIGAALKSLFGLDIKNLLTDVILPIGLGLLAPLYWMSTIPSVDEPLSDLTDDPGFVSKSVAFLGTWLLAPLTLIYALILIAYGVKIILAGALPKGEIAALTTPFLLIGTLTWLLLDPPFIRGKTLAKLFRKSWFFLSIPAAFLLAISVIVRVSEYGLTDERFALILCFIWALGIGLWFTFGPKDRRDIRFIPGLAAMLLTFGTFASLGFSQLSQSARAKSALKAAGVMSTDGIVKPLSQIEITDERAARNAHGAIDYLFGYDGDKAVQRLFRGAEDIPSFKENWGTDAVYKRLKITGYKSQRGFIDTRHYKYDGSSSVTRLPNSGWVTKSYTLHWGSKSVPNYGLIGNDDGGLKLAVDGRDLTLFWPEKDLDTKLELQNWLAKLPREGDVFKLDGGDILLQETSSVRAEMKINMLNQSFYNDDDYSATLEFQILVIEKGATPNP